MSILSGVLTLVVLYAAKLYNYLLFHSLVELFSIIIACGIFIITWNTRRFAGKQYFLFIGIAYMFVGVFDLFHLFSYKNLGIFEGYTANLSAQLWIAARYLQSLSLLCATLLIDRKLKLSIVFGAYILVAGLLFSSIFAWKSFPDCFIEGSGLTSFKIASEYLICAILLTALAVLFKNRASLDDNVVKLISASIIVTVFSELVLTLYVDVYDFFNMLGHYLKAVSFYLIYRAIVAKVLTQPYATIFRDLKRKEILLKEVKEEQQTILDSVPAWIFYKDRENRYLMVNKAFAEILGMSKDQLEGKSLFDIYPREQAEVFWMDDKEVIASGKPKIDIILPINTSKGRRWIQSDKIPYRDTNGNIIGTIGFAIDITERKLIEEERESLIAELQKALAEVKKLSGFLPICSACKKIRNDKGYWEQIESYIGEHSEALFSHGICPECVEKLYPKHNTNSQKKKQN
ncbi:MAG: MASE3 domain-containing protein [Smithellaceae bacterium]